MPHPAAPLTVTQAVALSMYRSNEPFDTITEATGVGPRKLKDLATLHGIVRHGTADGLAQHRERTEDFCNRCSTFDASLRAEALAQQRLQAATDSAAARYGRSAVLSRRAARSIGRRPVAV